MRLIKALILLASAAGWLAEASCSSVPPNSLASHDASRWQREIAAYETADAVNPPPRGGIVFTGASYIRNWKSLAADFPGLPVINRGFGGCELADVDFYADRIIIPYAPREVVVYAGGNDINAGMPSKLVAGDFVALMTKLHQALPAAKLVFISCPPSPKRWAETEKIREVNALIAHYSRHHDIVFVNAFALMLGADGRPLAGHLRQGPVAHECTGLRHLARGGQTLPDPVNAGNGRLLPQTRYMAGGKMLVFFKPQHAQISSTIEPAFARLALRQRQFQAGAGFLAAAARFEPGKSTSSRRRKL